MKVVLLTSDSLRHKYIAATLAEELELSLIVIEKKSAKIQDTSAYGEKDAKILVNHFRARAKTEEDFFRSFQEFRKDIPTVKVPHGSINSEFVMCSISQADPDFIILFGTSIIKEPVLSKYKGRIINLHLGLSPYYKGSATNLYPYLFDEPECIGATIHLATEKVDEGAILHQFRPEIEDRDTLHDMGNKVIQKAGQVLPRVLQEYKAGKIRPVVQKGNGRLTRNKDITPYVLQRIYKNFEGGMITSYIKNKKDRDAKRPIVDQLANI